MFSPRSPLLPVFLFGAVCTGATWLALRLGGRPFNWPYIAVLAWFTFITLALHLWQERAASTDVKSFMRRFMAGLVIKLLLSLVLVFVLIELLDDAPSLKYVVIAFVILYLAFLAFSTARLVMLLKRTTPSSTASDP